MGYAKRSTVTLTTDASGDVTGYTDFINGVIHSIEYVKTNFADGVDFTITGETTGTNLWTQTSVNAAVIHAPRHAARTVAGVALVYAGTDPVAAPVAVADERLKIVVADGGNAKSGTFHVLYG